MTDLVEYPEYFNGKPVIKLWSLPDDCSLGVIIVPSNTGVLYRNQTGGYNCNSPEIEGYIIPIEIPAQLFQEIFVNVPGKYQGWCCDGIDNETADILDKKFGQDEYRDYYGIKINRDRLKESMEAWLYIKWHGIDCIMTWSNSD